MQSFSQRGFRTIHKAGNGLEAQRILEENPDIGFLLTDVELPGLSGTRLIVQAKKMDPRMAMVVWTGKDPQPFEAYLNRFGTAVGKPINLEDVMDQAETLLERRYTRDPE